MTAWLCPDCGRQFSRPRQGHECSPAMSLEEYFSTGPPHERPVFDAVMSHLADVGPIHVEPVSVGIFLKKATSFLQLRPMQKWVAVHFSLSRPVKHRTIVRKVEPYAGRYHHVANVADPADLDQELLAYLAQAYRESPD